MHGKCACLRTGWLCCTLIHITKHVGFQRIHGLVDIAGYDVFGNKTQKTVVEAFNCPHCGLLRQPAKFAPHLEK